MATIQLPPAEVPPAPPPPTGLPPQEPGRHHHRPAWVKVTIIVAAVVVVLLTIGAVTGRHHGSPARPGPAPSTVAPALLTDIPNAVSFTSADGYTNNVSDLLTGVAATGLDTTIASAEEGQNYSGQAEVVIMTQTGGSSGTLEADVDSAASQAGMTYTVTHYPGYDALTIDGPTGDLQGFGQILENDGI